MNGETNGQLYHWVSSIFYVLPVMTAIYIAMVLVPEAADRWPSRFMSWQELSLVVLVMLLAFGSASPLCRLRYGGTMGGAGVTGVPAVISLFALMGGAAALLLHSSCWVVGAFFIGASLPPLVSGLANPRTDQPGRRFKM